MMIPKSIFFKNADHEYPFHVQYGSENKMICGYVKTSESDDEFQKQSPDVFYKKGVLKNFAKFTGKLRPELLRPATLLKKRLWHRCFPENFSKFLRTAFLTEHLRWLFLECANSQEIHNEGEEWLCCPVCHQRYHEDCFL